MSASDPIRVLDKSRPLEIHENSEKNDSVRNSFEKNAFSSQEFLNSSISSHSHINPETIRRKQKRILIFKFLAVSSLVCIPIVINSLSKNQQTTWPTSAAVMALGFLSFLLYRSQSRLRFQIESACHQLGPGVKLRRKYLKDSDEVYQIFQEGHRYYYVRSMQTGEKRLVPKDKILQDYDLAV